MDDNQPKPITPKEVLASHGLIEVSNPDGSKSQMTLEDAKKKKEELRLLNEAIVEAEGPADESQEDGDNE